MGLHGSGWWSFLRSTDEKPEVSLQLLKRVMSYSRTYYRHIAGMLVLILVNAVLKLLTPLILRDLIDNTIPNGRVDRLVYLALGLLIIPAASGFINVVQRRINATVGEGVIYDLRVALFTHLQRMSMRFFTNTKVGELMSRLNNDVVGAQNAISNTIVNIITNIIQMVAVLAVMFTLEWRLTLISIVILPLFIFVARRLATRLRNIARESMEANAKMNAMMNETLNIGGSILVKLFGRTKVEISRFRKRASLVRQIGIKRAVTGITFFMIIGLLSAIGTSLVYGVGGYLVIKEAFTIGTIVAFGAYLTSLYTALQGLANSPVEFATSMVSFERVFEILDMPLEIDEIPNAHKLERVHGEIIFDNVNFKYTLTDENGLRDVHRFGELHEVTAVLSSDEDKDHKMEHTYSESKNESLSQARVYALKDISFSVRPGQLAALVGPSGAGKTTITYLIPRLYDPEKGRILIDGHDLHDISLQSLTENIGMVTQETHLFHDTIRTNLLYANLNASEDEIRNAAQAANIHNFISELPDGYDTIVGERGYRLSGGEKQRIALARVILKDPQILVLDEATSHLDSESEALIQQSLNHVMAGRTSIVIAHRLSTILAADLILVLDRGAIVEQGTHEQLLIKDGLYSSLYTTQFKQSES